MRKLDGLVLRAKNKLTRTVQEVSETVKDETQVIDEVMMTKRAGDGKIIVSAILIVVAVALCVTFRTALQNWLTTLISYFENDLKVFTIPNS